MSLEKRKVGVSSEKKEGVLVSKSVKKKDGVSLGFFFLQGGYGWVKYNGPLIFLGLMNVYLFPIYFEVMCLRLKLIVFICCQSK
jgi:hypothetical protein